MFRNLAATAIILGTLLPAASAPATASDATGLWSTEDDKAQIRITQCDSEALCGAIASLKEPIDPQTGRAKTDKHNSDPALRNHPLIGTWILLGMKPAGTPNRWEGKVYNAEDGKQYTAYLTMTGASALKIEGCVLGGLICRSQTWSRVPEHGLAAGRMSK
jgi:uncharacterized protein (DUF2147 family)